MVRLPDIYIGDKATATPTTASKLLGVAGGATRNFYPPNLLLPARGELSLLAVIPQAQHAAIVAGTSTYDCAADIATALAECRPILVPPGRYRFDTTIQIDRRDACLRGGLGGRYDNSTLYGSQLVYYGTGPAIQIGTDNGHAWNANEYDGHQGFTLENLNLFHGNPATALGGGVGSYKAGGYGVRDWRGGDVAIRNCQIERFEYNFWGVQSDLNRFEKLASTYSKYGLYFGPRSDQCSVYDLYTFFCDTAIIADQCRALRFYAPQVVGCGTNTQYPVEIRGGSQSVAFNDPWLEHFQGYNGEVPAYFGVGLTAGYDGTTTLASGVTINNAIVEQDTQGATRHTKYLVAANDAYVRVDQVSGYVANLSRIFASTGANTPDLSIRQVGPQVTKANLYAKNGAAAPSVYAEIMSAGAPIVMSTNARFGNQFDPNDSDTANKYWQATSELPNALAFIWPNSTAAGTKTRLRWDTRINPGTAAPATNTWAVGDYIQNTAPAEAGSAASKYVILGWVCTVAGTPGTWLECRSLTGN